tara:strand:+ start:772 stop:1371 length:600 start_codon:yes stop_codon:yes gene_type:complete
MNEVFKDITLPYVVRGYKIGNKGNLITNWKKNANQYKRVQEDTWREHKKHAYHKGNKNVSSGKQYYQTKLNIAIDELQAQTTHNYYQKHKNTTQLTVDVHRLVALHHIELKPSNIIGLNISDEEWNKTPEQLKIFLRECLHVNHKDNDSLNNDVDNLEFCNPKANNHHYYNNHFTEENKREHRKKVLEGINNKIKKDEQ